MVEEDELEEEPPRPINLGDNLTIKRLLDEATAVVIDELGYPPDYKLSNIELFWGVNAVLIAPLAHFYPLPFPESRTILFICCVCYFICYGILQATATDPSARPARPPRPPRPPARPVRPARPRARLGAPPFTNEPALRASRSGHKPQRSALRGSVLLLGVDDE